MEKGQIFEKEIEAAKTHLTRVHEAVARRGGASGRTDNADASTVGDERMAEGSTVGGDDKDGNPFAALCNSGVFNNHSTITC